MTELKKAGKGLSSLSRGRRCESKAERPRTLDSTFHNARCKDKLNTLAVSVMNQWPGVRLRVTEGWDEEGHHAARSLHYEGRAVDLTTSDKERSKYGMLARLAVEAGFDWVYYESRTHIHCSVKSESYGAARSGGCFHGSDRVQTKSGTKSLSELLLGDEVMALASDGGLVFTEVISFLDRDPSAERLFYRVETESGRTVSFTPAHLVYYTATADGVPRPTFAARLVPGGYILVQTTAPASAVVGRKFVERSTDGASLNEAETNAVLDNDDELRGSPPAPTNRTESENVTVTWLHLPESGGSAGAAVDGGVSSLRLERVRDVTASLETGVFAPLTREGTLLVNGVAASCYAAVEDQALAHWAFLPVRLWEDVKDSALSLLRATGTLASRADGRPHGPQQSSLVGVHWYAELLYGVFYRLLPKSYLLD
ncbi:hypothetical protein HPB47_027016 [Ixodes persulcatus]|uniref:Uncharacterized protein n=1 Tax=Ixodes persulcatus TaxID=34615 RepID=A0AC60PX17_IXOPE|nr:hypothetical protein HPB47_027016 [Ixodes persulcatus]